MNRFVKKSQSELAELNAELDMDRRETGIVDDVENRRGGYKWKELVTIINPMNGIDSKEKFFPLQQVHMLKGE